MRKTFISVRFSVAEAERLIAFAEKYRDDWCAGYTPELANGIGKINDARKRLAERDREYRRLKPEMAAK